MKIEQKKLFKFSKPKRGRSSAATQGGVIRAEVLKNPEDEPPYFVRGERAGSKDEYWVGLALERIEKITGWGWDFQVPINGGRTRSGGNVVDFLIYTPGSWTILDPMGRPWHTGSREDRYQMENVARQRNWILIAWFTDQVTTREKVYQFLRKEMHV